MSAPDCALFKRDIEGDRIDIRVTVAPHEGKCIGVRILTGDAGVQVQIDAGTARALAATLLAAVEVAT